MQVNYEIGKDAWGGFGVFAAEKILKGTLVWNYDDANINTLDEKLAKNLCSNPLIIRDILTANYFDASGQMVDLRNDPGRYFNHSRSPNVSLGSVIGWNDYYAKSTFALRDIEIGEELLDDYRTYGEVPKWYQELLKKHGFDELYL